MDPRCQWCGEFKKYRHAQCRACARFPVQHRLYDLTYSRAPGQEHIRSASSKLLTFKLKLDGVEIGTLAYDYRAKPIPAWSAVYCLSDGVETVLHDKTFAQLLRTVRKTIEEAKNAA